MALSATEKLPDKFVHAITTFEDKRSHRHPGIDVLALGRAISDNFAEGRVVSGASTTMQVARLFPVRSHAFLRCGGLWRTQAGVFTPKTKS